MNKRKKQSLNSFYNGQIRDIKKETLESMNNTGTICQTGKTVSVRVVTMDTLNRLTEPSKYTLTPNQKVKKNECCHH